MGDVPIVLVHGIRLSGAMWDEQVELLSGEHPVHTLDLPGHGSRRGERFTLDGAVRAVSDTIGAVGSPVLLAGMSLGGYVSMATAARHSERVAGLLLAGCTLRVKRAGTIPFRIGYRVLSALPPATADRLNARLLRANAPRAVADAVIARGVATEVIPEVLRELVAFDAPAALGAYPGPTRLVNGGHDHFRLHENRFRSACRQGTLTIVPGAGHYLPLTHGEEFARLLSDTAALAVNSGFANHEASIPVTGCHVFRECGG